MTDTRRMTTDRFYGGVSNRVQNLRSMLEYVRSANPPRSDLNEWVISNTTAGSPDAVSHHLTFLASIDLIELSENVCMLGEYGEQWLNDPGSRTLYDALSTGVKGFDTILQALMGGSMTDEDIMELLVSEFDEANMTKPGPAKRHREWLQVLGLIEREGGTNHLTAEGRNLANSSRVNKGKNYQIVQSPDVGKIFSAKVDRISSSGNGIIECKKGHINIGPVTKDSVGEKIKAEMVEGVFAVCKTNEYKKESYPNNFPNSDTHLSKKSSTQNRPMVASSPKKSQSTISTTASIEFCDDCASMLKIEGDIWKCYSCGFEKKRGDKNRIKSLKTTEKSSITTGDEVSTESQNTVSNSNDSNNSKTKLDSSPKDSNTTKSSSGDSYSKNSEKLNINKLRKEAEEDAVDEVEQTTTTTTSTKSQYNRSTKVKDYVKARADGTCEGCGKPAPFTSATGEPYLHAHHVHELSDGGSDTPDTVIALCPNCHYRVHHGEDGDEYNQELLEIVKEREEKY